MEKVNKKEPIMEFKNQEELDECLKYWEEKLFLNDWTIKAKIIKRDEMELKDSIGENHFCFSNHCSMIFITELDEDIKSRIQKSPQELTLLHEICHLKIFYYSSNINTIQDYEWCEKQHSLVEQMAKSLLMVKYDLDFSWFKN